MSRYSPFYLGVFLGASLTIGSYMAALCVAPVQEAPLRSHVAPVGFSAPARPAPRTSRQCTQLASAHDRWVAADARTRDLQSKARGALTLALLSDHDDATHLARAKRFDADARRAERSAALALRALSSLRERDAVAPSRCVY